MLQQLMHTYRENIDFFFDTVDLVKAQEILEVFQKTSGSIIFTGVGKSGAIAEKLAMTMISTGTKAFFMPPTNALHGDIGILQPEDTVVFISKSGESDELHALIPYIKKKKATLVAWISNPNSRLLSFCDHAVILPIHKEICPYDLAPTTSTAIQLIFGDVLAIALMQKSKFSLNEFAQNHPGGSIGKKISLKVDSLMLKGEYLPLCDQNALLKDMLVTLSEKQCGCLVALDDKGHVTGVLTDGDLRRALEKFDSDSLKMKVKDLMTTSFLHVSKEARLLEALKLMHGNSKKWITVLPVLECGQCVGLLRMHDIVQSGVSV